ncbi:PREDICTED: liver carboxylesterase 1-like [Dinoponera quadriceps]|uniref:Liver carboxylesterase 1-like n=1 Tax=Dinoponera quadriceps TaxID=609295 RepID=A0A6P3XUW5_DINQU|nr:PREDICTED: liver carboxylesterase 1-like [Dinoponera quadriceps]
MGGRVSLLFILFFCSFVHTQDINLIRRKRIVGGTAALQPPVDDPVVFVNKNGRYARIIGKRDPNKGFYTFRGIRFGQPPTGQNRFQRATPVYLEGEYNATTWGPPCPQPSRNGSNKIVGSEDCLFLNVFTPSLPDSSDGYPVLIWIHGGGFRRGAACQYEMRNLIKKQMVVVSIQYRLGSLGFLSTGTKELPGNNGMFDMILAVDWVKDYIRFFGGNPNKTVAFGHGTGASSATMLSLSKFCKNSFSGLIAMSGSILSHFAVDRDPTATARSIAHDNGCPTNNIREMVSCLRELPVEKLIETDSKLENVRMTARGFISGLSNLLGAGPVLDGADDKRSLPNFMIQSPEDAFRLDNFPTIPLLTGVMKDETGGAISGGYKNEVQDKLNTVPNYLTSDFVPRLQDTIPNMQGGSRLVPQAFNGYLNIFGNDGAQNTIGKVAEALGDSLYNVPAFLTVDRWSKKANAFLYTFDHKGKRNYGKNFLAGLPIVDACRQAQDGNLNHGDDLAYIFGQNTITGEEISENEEPDEADERVTEIFTDMIANFARSGTLNVPTASSKSSWFPDVIPTFSNGTNPFVSITTFPKTMSNFRYCEMGLWTVVPERLQSPACSLYKVPLQLIQQGSKEAISVVQKPIDTLGGLVPGLKPGLNVVDKPTNQNTEGNNNRKNTIQKTHDELSSKVPLPRIPFLG